MTDLKRQEIENKIVDVFAAFKIELSFPPEVVFLSRRRAVAFQYADTVQIKVFLKKDDTMLVHECRVEEFAAQWRQVIYRVFMGYVAKRTEKILGI